MIEGKIISFTRLKNNKGVKVSYTENVLEDGSNTLKEKTVKINRAPSDNLNIILNSLSSHLIYSLGLDNDKLKEKEFKNRRIVDMPEFEKFKVVGYDLKGDFEDEKVCISAEIKSRGGAMIPIKSPYIPLQSGHYQYEDILRDDMTSIRKEVEKYLEGNNYATLFNQEEEQEEVEEHEGIEDDNF